MKDNRTRQLCEECGSHLIKYKEDERLIITCSYCGSQPEEIYYLDELEVDDLD